MMRYIDFNTNLNTCPFLNVLKYFKRTYLNALLNCSTLIVANRRKSPMNNRWWSEWCSTRDWHNFQIVGKTYPEDRWTVMVHYTGILPSTCNCDFAKLDTISIGTCILVFVIFFTLKRKDNACKQIQVVVLIKLKKSFLYFSSIKLKFLYLLLVLITVYILQYISYT